MQVSIIFPLIFVVLWASAFATGSIVTHDATPFAALALRFCLVTIGFLALIWGVLPILGGGKMSPYLVVGAIVAFGFLVLSESTGDNLRW